MVTKGENGSEVFHQGIQFSFAPRIIVHPLDTIGAGDTHFAYFVITFLKTGDVCKSGAVATEETSVFLMRKEVGK